MSRTATKDENIARRLVGQAGQPEQAPSHIAKKTPTRFGVNSPAAMPQTRGAQNAAWAIHQATRAAPIIDRPPSGCGHIAP
jgi:hypothetical protein